jgi:hypothetical protein
MKGNIFKEFLARYELIILMKAENRKEEEIYSSRNQFLFH